MAQFPSLRSLLVVAAGLAAGCRGARPDAHPGPHFTYEGSEGPAAWGGLAPEWSACGAGHAQSPIDLVGAVGAPLPAIEFHYQPSTPAIVNNGHTVQIVPAAGSSIAIGGVSFALVNIHFHHPSEHVVDGKSFPLELHLVHKSADGRLAAVGLLVAIGAENSVLAPIWSVLPKPQTEAHVKVAIDPSALLPAERNYFAYEGSLTTPPCTEGVRWLVMKTPIAMSPSSIDAFAALFGNNARPLQPLGARTLQEQATH